MLFLGVNIDHVATLRQARYRDLGPEHPLSEPCPVLAAHDAVAAGAFSITAHLREDRRHIQEHDVLRLKKELSVPLNLEMAVTPSMIDFACALQPEEVCLVPENRQEVSTEGGLDVAGNSTRVRAATQKLLNAGIKVSLFIDPVPEQIQASCATGATCIELHTGCFAHAQDLIDQELERQRLELAAEQAYLAGLQVNAGHGLHYKNLTNFLSTPHLHTLNIGHAIIARSISVGTKKAVEEILLLMKSYHS
jgi:pyridoxine 5-phosphate synthase